MRKVGSRASSSEHTPILLMRMSRMYEQGVGMMKKIDLGV